MKKVITISREYGAGGHSIGTRVAQELGIPFYDRDIVQETVKASGFELDLVEQEGEDISKAASIFKSICAITSSNYQDPQDAIHDVQQAVILRFAQDGYPEELLRLFVAVKTTDIKSSRTHRPCMHHGVVHHIMGKVAGGILAASVLHAMTYTVEVLLKIDIERRHSPM
jgi:hypothetical protein